MCVCLYEYTKHPLLSLCIYSGTYTVFRVASHAITFDCLSLCLNVIMGHCWIYIMEERLVFFLLFSERLITDFDVAEGSGCGKST